MLGKTKDKGKRRWQRMRQLHSITDPTDLNLSKLWEIVEDRGAQHAAADGRHKESNATQQLKNKRPCLILNVQTINFISKGKNLGIFPTSWQENLFITNSSQKQKCTTNISCHNHILRFLSCDVDALYAQSYPYGFYWIDPKERKIWARGTVEIIAGNNFL